MKFSSVILARKFATAWRSLQSNFPLIFKCMKKYSATSMPKSEETRKIIQQFENIHKKARVWFFMKDTPSARVWLFCHYYLNRQHSDIKFTFKKEKTSFPFWMYWWQNSQTLALRVSFIKKFESNWNALQVNEVVSRGCLTRLCSVLRSKFSTSWNLKHVDIWLVGF